MFKNYFATLVLVAIVFVAVVYAYYDEDLDDSDFVDAGLENAGGMRNFEDFQSNLELDFATMELPKEQKKMGKK